MSDSGALGWSLRVGISNMFSGHADTAGAGTTLDTLTLDTVDTQPLDEGRGPVQKHFSENKREAGVGRRGGVV